MKKNAAIVGVLLAGTFASAACFAQDSAVRVRAGLAAVSYVSPDSSGVDFKSSYAAAQIGASYITGSGWYGDLAMRTSLSAKWNTADIIGNPGAEDDDFSRNEVTLTIGKSLGNGLAVFAGLQVVSAEATLSKTNSGLPADESITLDNTIAFVGASKSIPVGAGSMSFSGALGVLKEETKNSAGLGGGTQKADTGAGFSLGAGYSHPITQAVSVLADLKFQTYSVKYPGSTDSSNQTVTSLGLSVVGQF